MDINVNEVNKSQKNDNNKVPRYLNDENSSKQSGSIFDNNYKMPTVIGELEKQNKKLDSASNKPAFEMTKAEKQEAEKLNKEQIKPIPPYSGIVIAESKYNIFHLGFRLY